jgi:hypothetical protein
MKIPMSKFTLSTFKRVLFFLLWFGCHSQVQGQTWQQVPSPDASATRNMLRGISGTSSSDIWTVGSFEQILTVPPYNKQNDLIMHWDGSMWFTYPPMNISTSLDDLFDVEAIAPNNVWAVGIYNHISNASQAELLHFNGTSWQTQNPPIVNGGSGLFSIDALSATDIWAAGGKTSSPTRPAYVLHYNGSSWTDIPVPAVGLYRNQFAWIDAVSPSSVWAGGFRGETTGDFHALVMRWNGSTWQNVALPSAITSPQSEVLSIRAISDNDVWVLGYYLAGGGFKIHWDGSSWTEMPSPNGGGGAFAAITSNNVFSVGSEIWHYDGMAWTLADPLSNVFYPALVNTVAFGNGDIWACGISMDASASVFHTLVYRNNNTLSSGEDPGAEDDIKIFPNPANDYLTVVLNDNSGTSISIIDAVGKVLEVLPQSLSNTVNLNLGNYPNGVYFLRVERQGRVDIKKFIISK